MAKGGKLVHPAQPAKQSLSHTLACPILFLNIDSETLRHPSETAHCATRCCHTLPPQPAADAIILKHRRHLS
jgi:hypothetical protein